MDLFVEVFLLLCQCLGLSDPSAKKERPKETSQWCNSSPKPTKTTTAGHCLPASAAPISKARNPKPEPHIKKKTHTHTHTHTHRRLAALPRSARLHLPQQHHGLHRVQVLVEEERHRGDHRAHGRERTAALLRLHLLFFVNPWAVVVDDGTGSDPPVQISSNSQQGLSTSSAVHRQSTPTPGTHLLERGHGLACLRLFPPQLLPQPRSRRLPLCRRLCFCCCWISREPGH